LAVESFTKAAEILPKNDKVWKNLGDAYSGLKDYKKALECYNKAIELNPDEIEYKKLRKQILSKAKY
jgi:tetratricopeptide (TPR) repeat protein